MGNCNTDPCQAIQIIQGEAGAFYVNLPSQSAPSGPTVGNRQEPFDLTNSSGVNEIVASFPGASGTPIQEKLSLSQIAVVGASGSGKIKINYSALDATNMLLNPSQEQFQPLQVRVTQNGVAQIDTLSIGGSVLAGNVYTATINGVLFSYTANGSDTATTALTALAALILGQPVTAVMSGANLVITSTVPALGFSDVVSSNITKTLSTSNSGQLTFFLFPGVLNIQPQAYAVT